MSVEFFLDILMIGGHYNKVIRIRYPADSQVTKSFGKNNLKYMIIRNDS